MNEPREINHLLAEVIILIYICAIVNEYIASCHNNMVLPRFSATDFLLTVTEIC